MHLSKTAPVEGQVWAPVTPQDSNVLVTVKKTAGGPPPIVEVELDGQTYWVTEHWFTGHFRLHGGFLA